MPLWFCIYYISCLVHIFLNFLFGSMQQTKLAAHQFSVHAKCLRTILYRILLRSFFKWEIQDPCLLLITGIQIYIESIRSIAYHCNAASSCSCEFVTTDTYVYQTEHRVYAFALQHRRLHLFQPSPTWGTWTPTSLCSQPCLQALC